MAATLGMGTITARSIAKWRWSNGKMKNKPMFNTLFPNGQRGDQGGHPTKGYGHHSRRSRRGNRS